MPVNPHTHACDVGTIDYSLVNEGVINCTECGRTWEFVEDKGWKADPLSRWRPGSPYVGTQTKGSNGRNKRYGKKRMH